MGQDAAEKMREVVDGVYRTDSRRVLATLIRLLGDFDLAEEAMHDAFAAAVEQWRQEGVPKNPAAWLISTGRFKAIDGMRRRARFDKSLGEIARSLEAAASDTSGWENENVEDDRLRLIFTCSHPALSPRRPDRADAARSLRPHDGRDRPRLPYHPSHGGAADRAGQEKNQGRGHSLSGAVPARSSRSA
ncbi:MAG: sigma factor [Candidatus Manganitrophus sp.]|nr:MAG: sigma factor [Candidatus Manganitrophus sp.]